MRGLVTASEGVGQCNGLSGDSDIVILDLDLERGDCFCSLGDRIGFAVEGDDIGVFGLLDGQGHGVVGVVPGCGDFLPAGTFVIGYHPLAVLYLQLRGDAILSVGTIRARISLLSLLSLVALGTDHRDLVALVVEQPFSVDRPVQDTILGSHSDGGSLAGLSLVSFVTLVSLGTVRSVHAVVDSDAGAIGEGDEITFAIVKRQHAFDGYLGVDVLDEGLDRSDVGVELRAEILKVRHAALKAAEFVSQGSVVILVAGANAKRDRGQEGQQDLFHING